MELQGSKNNNSCFSHSERGALHEIRRWECKVITETLVLCFSYPCNAHTPLGLRFPYLTQFSDSKKEGERKWRRTMVGHRVQAEIDLGDQWCDKHILCMDMGWAGVKEKICRHADFSFGFDKMLHLPWPWEPHLGWLTAYRLMRHLSHSWPPSSLFSFRSPQMSCDPFRSDWPDRCIHAVPVFLPSPGKQGKWWWHI